jgi:DNA-directed RNA polymerase specialized sigma24 family protein
MQQRRGSELRSHELQRGRGRCSPVNLRRHRERQAALSDDGELGKRPTAADSTHDQVERHERLHQGAEALARLKPQEARALRLKAEGHSYKDICQIADWTYTKVNR